MQLISRLTFSVILLSSLNRTKQFGKFPLAPLGVLGLGLAVGPDDCRPALDDSHLARALALRHLAHLRGRRDLKLDCFLFHLDLYFLSLTNPNPVRQKFVLTLTYVYSPLLLYPQASGTLHNYYILILLKWKFCRGLRTKGKRMFLISDEI